MMFLIEFERSRWEVHADTMWGRCIAGDDVGRERQFKYEELTNVIANPHEYEAWRLSYHNAGDESTDETEESAEVDKIIWN